MDTLIHADIFFFVTTIAVVVIGLAFTIALCCLIALLRRMNGVVRQVQEEVQLLRTDIHDARTRVQAEGFRLKHLIDFFSGFKEKKADGSSRKRSK